MRRRPGAQDDPRLPVLIFTQVMTVCLHGTQGLCRSTQCVQPSTGREYLFRFPDLEPITAGDGQGGVYACSPPSGNLCDLITPA